LVHVLYLEKEVEFHEKEDLKSIDTCYKNEQGKYAVLAI